MFSSQTSGIYIFIINLSPSLFPAEPLPLMDLCRRAARLALGRERLQEIESLPLPQSLKNYLQYQWLTPAEHKDTNQTTRETTARWMEEMNTKVQREDEEWKNVHTESTEAQQKKDG